MRDNGSSSSSNNNSRRVAYPLITKLYIMYSEYTHRYTRANAYSCINKIYTHGQ